MDNLKNAGINVLIVDDEPSIRHILSHIFSIAGYDVKTAEDGLEALDLLEKNSFDVILTDLNMPNMTGLELISQKPPNGSSYWILMSGNSNFQTAQKHGFDDYMQKPIHFDDLVDKVKKAYEKRIIRVS